MDVPADIAINMLLFQHYAKSEGSKLLLFDLESDPSEEKNIADNFPDIVNDILKDVEELKKKRPKHPKYWMMSTNWTEGFVPGKGALISQFSSRIKKKKNVTQLFKLERKNEVVC